MIAAEPRTAFDVRRVRLGAAVLVGAVIGGLAGGGLWPPLAALLGGLWFLATPLFIGPLYTLLLLGRSAMDSWAEGAAIVAGGFSINPLGLINLLLLATLVPYLLMQLLRHGGVGLFWPLRLYVLFAAYLAASVLWSLYPGQTVRETVRTLALLAAFILSSDLVRREPAWAPRFAYAMLLAAAVPAGLALLQFASGAGLRTTEGLNRVFGTFWHPSALGIFLMFINLLALSLCAEALRRRRASVFFHGAVFALTAAVAFLTYTRAVWIALPVGWLVTAWYSAKGVVTRAAYVLAVAAAGALVTVLLWPVIAARFTTELEKISGLSVDMTANPLSMSPIHVRIYMWTVGWRMFESSPWLGQGWGVFPLHLTATTPMPPGFNPHNDYIKLLAEGGGIALVLFALLMVALYRTCVVTLGRVSGQARCFIVVALASLAAYLTAAITDNPFGYSGAGLYFWTVMGIAYGLAMRGRSG